MSDHPLRITAIATPQGIVVLKSGVSVGQFFELEGLVRHRVVARDEDFFFAYGFRHREAPGGGFRREL